MLRIIIACAILSGCASVKPAQAESRHSVTPQVERTTSKGTGPVIYSVEFRRPPGV